ncbi:MAG TPA: aminoacyl-tRNA hydrolase [Terriglobia bacterium]|nr:aminoacyl-tRNA hydrolase [Terriglobia bacterium]
MWLIVGLGNPGPEYADTYHNVGFRVVETLAGRFGTRVSIHCGPALISSRIESATAVLVLPQTFMNLSGAVLPKLFERFETGPEDVIAVYDDIALPMGKLRIRQKGSAGGHNGVKSLISSCGSDEFLRVRVGILPERPVGSLHDFVLSRVAKRDRDLMGRAELSAADAVEALLKEGPAKAMATFNRLDLRESKED